MVAKTFLLLYTELTSPENTMTYHDILCFKWPQEKLKTMLMQNFGVTNKEHYGMLWYFLEGSIQQLDLVMSTFQGVVTVRP